MWLNSITRMAIGCVALHFCSALTYAQINVTNSLKVPDKSGKCVETKILGQPMYVKRGWTHAYDCGEKQSGKIKITYGTSHLFTPCSSTLSNTPHTAGYVNILYWDKKKEVWKQCAGTSNPAITIHTGDCGAPCKP